MKRILGFVLAMVMVLALVGCTDSQEPFNVERDTEALLNGGRFRKNWRRWNR